MAKVRLNPAVAAMSGKIGDFVYRQLWGRQVVGKVPDFSRREFTEPQKAELARFGAGSLKWNGLSREVKALYTARAKELQMPPCALYQKDNARLPSVEDIDLSAYTGQMGQTIRISAIDLVDVASVEVTIRLPGGETLESGAATRVASGDSHWTYRTTAVAASPAGVTVAAVASNWPGNKATAMKMVGVPS